MSTFCDRRAFFRSVGRGAVIGGMGLFAFLLYGRQRRNPEVCINRSVCGTCSAFEECELPAARSAKGARHVAQEEASTRGESAGLASKRLRQDACATSRRTGHA